MSQNIQIKNALISVFNKENLEPIINTLNKLGVQIYSTGGTQKFIEELGVKVHAVEDLTGYPSILGGRVKTLHPKVFGGILARRDNENDQQQLKQYEIPTFDLVIVDLYPFEETVQSGADHQSIIEKIDIGGISLIRAAAKNYKDVAIVASRDMYGYINDVLNKNNGATTLEERKYLSAHAFSISSHYDIQIFNYLNDGSFNFLKLSEHQSKTLRYGENPHQKATFFGDLEGFFEQLNGKELSYNNLLDIDAAVNLIEDFKTDKAVFAILKHNNACGLAIAESVKEAYENALAADPLSAFGGILITNKKIDLPAAELINGLFCEVLIAPDFDEAALNLLKSKKNRIILKQKGSINKTLPNIRTALNGWLVQDKDTLTSIPDDLKVVTEKQPAKEEIKDMLFANIIVKHTKSNTIVLAKNNKLIASGTGQTSRVDALKQAIEKAKHFGFDLKGAVMASDAFFPFPDCVEIAHKEGIDAVIQPGGSIKDQASIDYCNENNMTMVFTGIRHFKH